MPGVEVGVPVTDGVPVTEGVTVSVAVGVSVTPGVVVGVGTAGSGVFVGVAGMGVVVTVAVAVAVAVAVVVAVGVACPIRLAEPTIRDTTVNMKTNAGFFQVMINRTLLFAKTSRKYTTMQPTEKRSCGFLLEAFPQNHKCTEISR